MKTEIRLIPSASQTLYVEHPTASYGIFCWNDMGDLFLNSDWGMFGHAWRSMGEGETTTSFLARTSPGYIVQKFENNQTASGNKKLNPAQRKNVMILLDELIQFCKTQCP